MSDHLCPLCRVNQCDPDPEGPSPRDGVLYYSSYCTGCTLLSGYRTHTHTYYPSPAQVAAGTFKAGHSWRTLVAVRPMWESGSHVGFRCSEFGECGWKHRFTADERMLCDQHQALKGMCVYHREHAQERGECDERGYITEFGREEERRRSNRDNWDPGRYIQ